jgi:copper chaperone
LTGIPPEGVYVVLEIPPWGIDGRRVLTTSEYQVSGMSCGHCEAAIQGEGGQIPGVQGVNVSARTGRLVVTSWAPIDAKAVLGGVDEAGYEAVLVA